MSRWQPTLAVLFSLALRLAVPSTGSGQIRGDDSLSTSALKRRSLEELMDIDVTIVAKRSQRWFEAPAAVYVISNDDIRRSGARSLPEALRLAPNLNVAQVNASQWSISSRGFNSTTANKLLVLIDGRSVYTPLYSGVFWDVQDVVLEDIDRIEVISGPGGTLWGTNAVNGIINILTKSSGNTNTKPFYVQVGAGIAERSSFAVRSKGTLGTRGFHRSYVKFFDRGETTLERAGDAHNSWSSLQGGFRMDYDLSSHDFLTLTGDAYRAKADQLLNGVARMEGGNLLAKWTYAISGQSALSIQSYFDYGHRRLPQVFGEDLGVFDFELEHRTTLAEIHELNWGVGFRHSNDRVINSAALAFLPPNLQAKRYNGFVQDIIAIADGVKVTVGTKFSKGTYAGFQIQPRVSIGWTRSNWEFFWASVSRAVRTPSRIDRDLYVPGNPPYLLAGGPEFISEKVIAFETGSRVEPQKDLFFDLALYYNLYDDVRSLEPGSPIVIKNGLEAKTYGGEITVHAKITNWWRVRTGYSYFEKSITLKPWSMDVNAGSGEGNDHKHRVLIQSFMDVMENWEVDIFFRFVDKLPNQNAFVPSYASLDCRLGWNPAENLLFSVLFQNVFPARYVEFGASQNRHEIEREVYGRISISL